MADMPTHKRRLQQVRSKSQKQLCLNYMINEVDSCDTDKTISVKAVNQFPTLFRQCKMTSKERALSWWKAVILFHKSWKQNKISV